MAKTTHVSSKDAALAFKSKVGDCLPLLGFVESGEKSDLWRFWKTISSAVKIAVNGKGDIVDTPRRGSRNSKDVRRTDEEELQRLRNLEKNAMAIYTPVKCAEKGFRKYRVLKLLNQNKIADYFECVPVNNEEEDNVVLDTSGDFQFSEIADLLSNGMEIIIKDENTIDELSQVDACSLLGQENSLSATTAAPSASNIESEKIIQSVSYESENKGASVMSPPKPRVKIWPVSKPTTRSATKSQKTSPSENVSKPTVKHETEFATDDKCVADPSPEMDPITIFPPQKEGAKNESQDEFNITIVPMDGKVVQIIHDESQTVDKNALHEEVHEESMKDDGTPMSVPSASKMNEVNNPEPGLFEKGQISNCVNDLQTVSDFYTPSDSHQVVEIKMEESIPESHEELNEVVVAQADVGQAHGHSHVAHRNTSDIETIISALEEELKKSDVGSISINSHGKCDDSSEAADQTIHFVQGQGIVEVQNVEDVIWTTDGAVQVVGQHTIIEASGTEQLGLEEVGVSHPIDAQYDVVEYEVLADKRKTRTGGGRKKKMKDSVPEKDKLDRTCPMCHRVLTYASSMAAHMRIHTGDRPYSCGQCDRKFTTKANRDRHEATHVGLKPFKCTECDKAFTEKRSLKIHMRSHTGERPFICTVCSRGFAQKCTLLVHMDRHTNKKGHLCDLCGKAFRQKCQLDIHVKRHYREANYPCPQCSVKCYTRGDLVRHMIKHTGERPYHCTLCPRNFTRKQYLMDHENTHFGRTPYKCSVCSASFHDMGSCHRHLRKHKMEEEEEGNPPKSSKKTASALTTEDFNTILKGSQTGEILTLEDGTRALVKAVESESDGSTVYHITCVGNELIGEGDLQESEHFQAETSVQSESEATTSLPSEADATVHSEANAVTSNR